MEDRLAWVQAYECSRNGAEVCRRFGISAATLRKWWRRFEAEGAAGLADRSRAPAHSPTRRVTPADLDALLALRREGLGFGRIRARMAAQGRDFSLPTIRRALARHETPPEPRRRPAPPEGLVRNQAPEGLAAQIAGAIQHGAFHPGERLAEEALARRFGVGRTKVREALRSLAFLGVVRIARNRGAFVARPSREEVAHAYEARRVVEAGIVAGLGRLTPAQVETLEAHIRLQESAETAGQQLRLVQLLSEFHLVLAGMGPNPFLRDCLDKLAATTTLAFLLYDGVAAPSCAVQEHRALVAHLARGETAAATTLMLHHLGANQARVEKAEGEHAHPHA